MTNIAKFVFAVIVIMFAASLGWLGTACVSHLYQDHQLIDQARANADLQRQQQVEQIRQFQQSQQGQVAPTAPAPPLPAK